MMLPIRLYMFRHRHGPATMKSFSAMAGVGRPMRAARRLMVLLFVFVSALVVCRMHRCQVEESLRREDSSRQKQSQQEPQELGVFSGSKRPYNPLQKRVDSLFREDYEHGRKLLSDMDSIRRANSHVLPRESYFFSSNDGSGTNNRLYQNTDYENAVDELCVGKHSDGGKSCVGKFGKGLTNFYMVVPRYETFGCIIRKNMNTLLKAVLCYLKDEEKVRASGATLSFLGYIMHLLPGNGLCEGGRDEHETKSSPVTFPISALPERRTLPESWKMMAVVREPVDRFLSGFVDKCIRHPIEMKDHKARNFSPCNGCGYNLTCFVITEYERMKKFYESTYDTTATMHHLSSSTSSSGSEKELQRVETVEDTMEDHHFFPQNWLCGFDSLLPRYTLLRYTPPVWQLGVDGMLTAQRSGFLASLVAFLENVGVGEESLAYIRKNLETGTTVHKTHDSRARRFLEQRLRGSPFLMEFIVRMFYWDFRLLGFEMPAPLEDLNNGSSNGTTHKSRGEAAADSQPATTYYNS